MKVGTRHLFSYLWATSFGFLFSYTSARFALLERMHFFHKKLFLVFFCLLPKNEPSEHKHEKVCLQALSLFFSFLICLKEIKFHQCLCLSASKKSLFLFLTKEAYSQGRLHTRKLGQTQL